MAIECTPGTLVDLASCFSCLSPQQIEAIKTYLLAVTAGGTTDPGELIDAAKCFMCLEDKQFKAIQTNLLCQIANGGSGSCDNLEGASSPQGLITPDFVGQVFVQDDGTIWQAGGLLNSSWTVIGIQGLQWGPSPNTVTNFVADNSAATTISQYFSNNIFPGTAYTEWLFTKPVHVNGFLAFSNFATEVTRLSFFGLVEVVGNFNADVNPVMAILEAPVLNAVGGDFSAAANDILTELDLPSLATVGARFFSNANLAMQSLLLPSLVTITGGVDSSNCGVLANVSVPNWIPTDGSSIDFSGCALSVTSVEQILRRCVLAGVTTCTINLSGGTNAGTASLSAQGQADVATLGGQVTMNP